MMTYSWEILPLNCIISQDGLTNIVESIPWRYTGVDEEGGSFTLSGVTMVPSPNPEAFTAFNSLTREIVIGWLEVLQDQQRSKEIIMEQIYRESHPTQVVLSLPL